MMVGCGAKYPQDAATTVGQHLGDAVDVLLDHSSTSYDSVVSSDDSPRMDMDSDSGYATDRNGIDAGPSYVIDQDESLGLPLLNMLSRNWHPESISPSIPLYQFDLPEDLSGNPTFKARVDKVHQTLSEISSLDLVPFWELNVIGLDKESALAKFLFPVFACAQRLYGGDNCSPLKVRFKTLDCNVHQIRFEVSDNFEGKSTIVSLIHLFSVNLEDLGTPVPEDGDFKNVIDVAIESMDTNDIRMVPTSFVTDLRHQSLAIRYDDIVITHVGIPTAQESILDMLAATIGIAIEDSNFNVSLWPQDRLFWEYEALGCRQPSHLPPTFDSITRYSELDVYQLQGSQKYRETFRKLQKERGIRWLKAALEKQEEVILRPAKDQLPPPGTIRTPIGRLVSSDDPSLQSCQRILSYATRNPRPRFSFPPFTDSTLHVQLVRPICISQDRWSQLFEARLISESLPKQGTNISDGRFVFKIFDERLYAKPTWGYYINAEEMAFNEAHSYELLSLLQGSGVPHCYGLWEVTLSDGYTCLGILLEYLEGANFRGIFLDDDLHNDSNGQGWLHFFDKTAASAAAINLLGVFHTDLNSLDNVICLRSDKPCKCTASSNGEAFLDPVIIDFGFALDPKAQNFQYKYEQSEVLVQNDKDYTCDQDQVYYFFLTSRFSADRDLMLGEWLGRLGSCMEHNNI